MAKLSKVNVIGLCSLFVCATHAGTLTITPSNSSYWTGMDVETSSSQLTVNYDTDFISGTRCALVHADSNMTSMQAEIGLTYIVTWTPSYPGEVPSVSTNPDGTIPVNVTYTLSTAIYGASGTGSVKDRDNNILANTVAGTASWTSRGTRTDTVRILPRDDGTWGAEVSVGNLTLAATGAVTTKVKFTSVAAAFPPPQSPMRLTQTRLVQSSKPAANTNSRKPVKGLPVKASAVKQSGRKIITVGKRPK